jgi:hypothetical protein
MGGGGSKPPPVSSSAPPPPTPESLGIRTEEARMKEKNRMASARGRMASIMNVGGAGGLQGDNVANKKTLLGQ